MLSDASRLESDLAFHPLQSDAVVMKLQWFVVHTVLKVRLPERIYGSSRRRKMDCYMF
jgi:hypothetical protein